MEAIGEGKWEPARTCLAGGFSSALLATRRQRYCPTASVDYRLFCDGANTVDDQIPVG
jgi:hypothetical protein